MLATVDVDIPEQTVRDGGVLVELDSTRAWRPDENSFANVASGVRGVDYADARCVKMDISEDGVVAEDG